MAQHQIELLATVGRPEGPFPPPLLPEVAFAGRSNVGKSSLINRLLGRKGLAHVSKRPGKTTTVNIFRVDGKFHLADLPGYGFARVPGSERRRWGELVNGYLRERTNLVGVMQLIDARHEPQPADYQMWEWLRAGNHPFLVIATKMDKLKRSQRSRQLRMIASKLGLDEAGFVLPSSAEKGEGVREIWREIRALTSGQARSDDSEEGSGRGAE